MKTSPNPILLERTLPGIGPACPVPLAKERAKRGKLVPNDLILRRRAHKRRMKNGLQERNAIHHLLELPATDEAYHFVIGGQFDPCALIPATARLAHPATIKQLTITTLSFNVDNIDSLTAGIDAKKIGSILLVASEYFSKVEEPLWRSTCDALQSRGSQAVAARVHCKLLLIELTDGRCFTFEGSGNLRSSNSIEQFVLTNSRELMEFHRAWLGEYIESRKTTKSREKSKRRSHQKPTK